MLKMIFREPFRKELRNETDYEREKRVLCERYFQQGNLVKWKTEDLPCVTLEELNDCGLITISDTVVYLPKEVARFRWVF